MSDTERPRLLKGPSWAPDCPWETMTSTTSIPENAVFLNGELKGEKIYIGRVNDGKCVYVGTAIPSKGICIYLDKKRQVHSSEEYEGLFVKIDPTDSSNGQILTTTSNQDPLWFVEASSVDKEQHNEFVAGVDENEEVLYIGRYIDSQYNTYYGWLLKDFKQIFIPRYASEGPQVLDEGFSILIHRHIHMMCTGCPMPVKGVHYF